MGRVKFNKKCTRAQALSLTTQNPDTIYFTTDSCSIIVNNREYKGNRETTDPVVGDAVYNKNGKVHYFKGGSNLNHDKLISEGYTGLGQVIGRKNGKAIYLDKDISSAPYLAVTQYAITAITKNTIRIRLWLVDWKTSYISVSLSDTSISQANATAISNAVAAKARDVGSTKDWWAYLDSANNRIIVQCDSCDEHLEATGTYCSINDITFEDMPASNYYYKSNGMVTQKRGFMNIAMANVVWKNMGRSNIMATDVWHGDIGSSTAPLNYNTFCNTSMYGTGQHQYATYEDYLRGEFGIMDNQNQGAFGLPSAKELGETYGNKTAPTKNGGTKYKFPALHYPRTIDRGVEGLRAGDLYLAGVEDGCIFMKDENMEIINATRQRMGHSLISNSSTQWFSQLYGNNYIWAYDYTIGGALSNIICYYLSRPQVHSIALLDIPH